MSSQITSTLVSADTAEAVTRRQLVYLNSSGQWAVATTSTPIATAVATDTVASGGRLAADLFNGGGTRKMIAAAAISAGAKVYQAAAGKISSTVAGGYIGVAAEASSADGDIIEVILPTAGQIKGVGLYRSFTADASIGENMSGAVISNLGASGTITVSLPTSVPAGTFFTFVVGAAQALRVDPGASDAIIAGGTVNADGKYLWADDEGETITLIADTANNWIAASLTGTWTIEP